MKLLFCPGIMCQSLCYLGPVPQGKMELENKYLNHNLRCDMRGILIYF